MPELYVLRVFCDEEGRHGNPLGVVLDGAAVPEDERQQVAATLGFSETVFVDDRATGALRIFTPKVELRLAGHPLVGTSWLLRVSILRPPAGEVPTGGDGLSAWIEADPADAPPFVIRQLASPAEVEALEVPRGPDVHEDVWAWIDPDERTQVRCRVFADGVGIVTENIFKGRFRYVDELVRMGADIRTEGRHADPFRPQVLTQQLRLEIGGCGVHLRPPLHHAHVRVGGAERGAPLRDPALLAHRPPADHTSLPRLPVGVQVTGHGCAQHST